MRRDLPTLRPGVDIAVGLHILTSRRAYLVADRTGAINLLALSCWSTSRSWSGRSATARARLR